MRCRTDSVALVLSAAIALMPLCAGGQTMQDVRDRLSSEFHQGLYARTYDSILGRIQDDGYFPESMTGAYGGMFPRTVGGLASLFIETGELETARRVVHYVLRATRLSGMERIPHVIGPQWASEDPVPSPGHTVQPEHPIALYRLDQPQRFGGAQEFTAPKQPIRAVELWLTGDKCRGSIRLQIAEELQAEALAVTDADASPLTAAGAWRRFEFTDAPKLTPGKQYVMRASFDGEGVPAWWGLDNAGERPLGAGHGRDTQIAPGWLDNPGHVTAFAIDTGKLGHTRRTGIPILCDRDQIDGQAHMIMAWARLALLRDDTAAEDDGYEQVARLMSRTSDWPYLSPYNADHPMLRAETGLVRNVCFEHSREGRFWDTFDILTQSFVCVALTEMIRVAQRRADLQRAGLWQRRLRALEQAIGRRMTRQLDGKTIYLEMRLPDGGGGVPFEGLGWVNFAPVAAQWEGVDPDILANTIEAYRARALFTWEGHTALALDWWPDRPLGKSVIGKGVGWEIVYCLQAHEPGRICQWLDFIEAVNTTPIYMEATGLTPEGDWHIADPGNGEQCVWWCWGMAKARKAVGLPPAP